MRLLYVLPEYPPEFGGGIATFYDCLLPALVRLGHQVDVIVGSAFTKGRSPYERDGVSVSFLDPYRYEQHLALLSHYEPFPELRRFLASSWAMHEQKGGGDGYDLVEAVDWGMLFVPWIVDSRVPAIVQLHGSTGQIDLHDPAATGALQGHLSRLLEADIMRSAAGIHAYSSANQSEWETATGRAVTYLPPPLPPVPKAVGSRVRNGRGLVVARIQKWKGPEVVCEALRRMGNDAPHIDWIGRDTRLAATHVSMDAHLRTAYPDVWGTRVTTVEQSPPADVARFQAEAGFVVVPSLWDVFNFTAVEAMRSGAVVVCSSGAGASELIEDGLNGFSFTAGNADALAAKLEVVIALSADARSTIQSEAQRTVRELLAPDKVAHDKVAAYREVIGRGKSMGLSPWLDASVRPRVPASGSALTFLDQQPLRELFRYASRRLNRKFFSGGER